MRPAVRRSRCAVDVDPERGMVHVPTSKGDRSCTVATDAGGMAILQRWIDVGNAVNIRRSSRFYMLSGESISANAVRQMMQRRLSELGLNDV